MKAHFVYESLDFERGQDPKSAIGVGLFGNMPKIGKIQSEPFDLKDFSQTICRIYKLPIKDYTEIDKSSNYAWDSGYQTQYVTMNLILELNIFKKLLGPEYYNRISSLMGKDYIAKIRLGIASYQKHWISKNEGGYEFDGNKFFIHVDAGGYSIPIDFSKEKNISNWLPADVKDKVMKVTIWDLRYKPPIYHQKTPQGSHMRDLENIKIDVKDFCKKYGQKELESLMNGNYMWDKSVRSWKITKGILEIID